MTDALAAAVPVWAGVIVTDLERALPWYADTTGARVRESTGTWATLAFRDGSALELHEGDPHRPGLTFPSYGADAGPPVMPGFAVDDADVAARGHDVARSLPGWIVVVAPGGMRVVLADVEGADGLGLVGFTFASAAPAQLRSFLEGLGVSGPVEHGTRAQVIPLVAGREDREAVDPDGNPLRLVRA